MPVRKIHTLSDFDLIALLESRIRNVEQDMLAQLSRNLYAGDLVVRGVDGLFRAATHGDESSRVYFWDGYKAQTDGIFNIRVV